MKSFDHVKICHLHSYATETLLGEQKCPLPLNDPRHPCCLVTLHYRPSISENSPDRRMRSRCPDTMDTVQPMALTIALSGAP